MADHAAATPLAVRFEYRFDRLLSTKLEQSYAVLLTTTLRVKGPYAPHQVRAGHQIAMSAVS